MMVISDADTSSSFKVTFKPNSALTANNKFKLILLLTVIPSLIGLGFTVLGAWLVLPFVGLEIAALAFAFYYVNCHESDYESICIEADSLTIERRTGQQTSQHVINPYWVKIVRHELANGELRVYLQSHGKEVEVGRFLTRKQRELLARQLQQRTGVMHTKEWDK
jgi:uncharacterized membrane protein